MEKAILSIGLSVILAIGLLSMRNGDGGKHNHKTAKTVTVTATDTLPGSATIQKSKFPSINTSIDDNGTTRKTTVKATDAEGNTFEMTRVNNEVTSLIINSRSIPKESFDQYMYIFDEIGRRSTRTKEERNDEIQARLELLQEEAQAKAERDQQEALEKAQQAQEEAQAKMEQDQQKAEMALEESQKEMERNQEEAQAKMEAVLKAQADLQEATDKHVNADRIARHIIHDLVDKQIIAETENQDLSFKLDNKELVVNGTKQPDEIFKFFKEKYLKSPKDHFIYKHTGSSTTYDVSVE